MIHIVWKRAENKRRNKMLSRDMNNDKSDHIVFLDRDGSTSLSKDGYVYTIKEFELIS